MRLAQSAGGVANRLCGQGARDTARGGRRLALLLGGGGGRRRHVGQLMGRFLLAWSRGVGRLAKVRGARSAGGRVGRRCAVVVGARRQTRRLARRCGSVRVPFICKCAKSWSGGCIDGSWRARLRWRGGSVNCSHLCSGSFG